MIALLAYQITYRYLKPFMSYRGFKRWKSDTHTHTCTHTSGRQLKVTFLDVLDYSEYSDTNISKFFFFHENIASSVRKQKSTSYYIFATYNFTMHFTEYRYWNKFIKLSRCFYANSISISRRNKHFTELFSNATSNPCAALVSRISWNSCVDFHGLFPSARFPL